MAELLTLAVAAVLGMPQAASPCLRASPPSRAVAFVDVTVIPMDRERVLAHRTVLVRGCLIERIGHRDSVAIPASYLRVPGGDDAFLLPGLVESHTHLRYENDLTLYLGRGITTVRNMIGDTMHVRWKRAIRAGALGPRVITAAPMPYQGKEWTAARISAFVDTAAAAGFDFLKVQDGTSPQTYEALRTAGLRRGMRVAGHIPLQVGLEGVLQTRQQTIEHAEQFNYRWFGESYDRTLIPELARRLKAAGAVVTPTVAVIHSWIAVHQHRDSLLTRPEISYVHPETLAYWNTFERSSSFDNRLIAEFQDLVVLELERAGVPLLSGTDAYMIGLVEGWGLLRELKALHAAGLTTYQVLKTATSTPAQVFGYSGGVVAEGKLADLILVKQNPLGDLDRLARLHGVMLDGVWHPQGELDARVEAVARRYASGNALVRLALTGSVSGAVDLYRRQGQDADTTRLDAGTLSYVATILRQRGRADDAIRLYELVLEESPRRASAYEGIARSHLSVGQIEPARAALRMALEIEPNRQTARQLLSALGEAGRQ